LAALMLVSQDTQAAVRSTLSTNGIELSGTYEVVTGIDGAFMPSAVPGKSLEEGYLIFDSITKGANEPYSATGDFDGDGVSNLDEYTNIVVNGGGSIEDFIDAATGGGGEGEGEGEGPGPSCAATAGSAVRISGDVAIILLALLFLVYRGNRRKHYSV
jgi:hypothetical protein